MRVINSHTEGEPTRVIVDGGPPLGRGPLAERLARFAGEFDHFRRLAVNEPRGHDAIVGALICEPHDPSCAAGVIFFNNVGYLGMCGHGAIGLAVTLAYMGRLKPGRHRFETPVGTVGVELVNGCTATVENVESYRLDEGVSVEVAGLGTVRGDVAWGGNWFFLTSFAPCDLVLANVGRLTEAATAIRDALTAQGVRGKDGALIDHIEFFATAADRTTRTVAILSSVPAAPTTGHRAEPEPAPSLRASAPTESCARARFGCRRASSAAAFARASNLGPAAAFSRASPDARSSAPRASWCRTPPTPSGTALAVRRQPNPSLV